jgi:hypothetical protein
MVLVRVVGISFNTIRLRLTIDAHGNDRSVHLSHPAQRQTRIAIVIAKESTLSFQDTAMSLSPRCQSRLSSPPEREGTDPTELVSTGVPVGAGGRGGRRVRLS